VREDKVIKIADLPQRPRRLDVAKLSSIFGGCIGDGGGGCREDSDCCPLMYCEEKQDPCAITRKMVYTCRFYKFG